MSITAEQMRFWSPEVRELEPYVPGEQPKIQNLLKLNTNENPYPPSPKVVEAVQSVLVNNADALRLYPDPDATALKHAIAKQQHVGVEQVFVGNGSDEVLAHIFKAFFIQKEPILYPDITYSFYPVYSQFFGTQTKQIPLNEKFEIDVSDYEQENGGIINTDLFESSEDPYNERDRLDVYFKDATSLLKGNRIFLDHSFKLNKNNPNSLIFTHQFNYQYKFFEFTQPTISNRFGASFSNNINNKTRYNNMYNKVGVGYKTKNFGDLEFFIDDTNYNYYYNSVVYDNSGNILVPNSISDRINMLGGNYTYFAKKLIAKLEISQAITNQSISNIEATVKYTVNSDYKFEFQYQKLNSLPNLNFSLYQSRYIDYNWANNFKNEKLNQFSFSALTKWLNAGIQYKVLNDHLYFDNTTNDITKLTVKPVQYDKTINYLSINANKEIKFWKFGLDVTLLYQKVDQSSEIVNVPELTTRSTLYFSDHVFKKAMLLQTGVTFQYFTEYFANDYNPLIGEFYVQNEKKIGNFPMFDFFVNARIKQARIYLKAEHFNSAMTGYNFYSAPNYPYRDFMVRFGLEWNFFK